MQCFYILESKKNDCVSPLWPFLSAQIRNAWDNKKSMARNLQEMGLAFDPNRTVPIKKTSVSDFSVTMN